MDHLSKQQLILLALLVSFVTSLSTGIVTVSLMDQAPAGVTRTVSQVIERTIQQAVPQSAAVADSVLTAPDRAVLAVKAVSQSVVTIEDAATGAALGQGLVVASSGAVVTDKSVIAPARTYQEALPNGGSLPLSVLWSQTDGDAVFLAPSVATSPAIAFTPAVIATSTSLGATVFALSGTSTALLGQGIIDSSGNGMADTVLDASSSPISVSIAPSAAPAGAILFGMDGSVLGIRTSSLAADGRGSSGGPVLFYPLSALEPAFPPQ
ncbi:MAG: hypothetical protein KGI69_02000 [Patescibacteria group bacterium]|nr:hypothetical protein [Patescibacteria group bacterium]